MKKYIILDRDGVINFDSDYYIKNPDEWIAIPGSLAAMADLNRAGYKILVVTNQSGVARGHYTLATLEKIHEKFKNELRDAGGEVEEIYFCPHHPDEKCPCRKPQPGLFYEIQKKYQLDFSEIYFIGDNLSDVQVAKKVGCIPLFVLTGKGAKMLQENPELNSVKIFSDLAEAVKFVIGTSLRAR
jgi:D-glycero-D-manno-heptose 1,7-bisphosphate phosphatase